MSKNPLKQILVGFTPSLRSVSFLGAAVLGILNQAAFCQGPPAAPVEVEIIEEISIVPTTTLLGATEPKRRSVVASAIEGYVIDYPIEEGERVKKDQILTKLRDTELLLRLQEAEAARGEIRERHHKAKLDRDRAKELIDKDAITQKEVDAAVTEEKALALRIPQAEARFQVLKANIAKKRVVAPFDGQVVREHAQVGEWVTRGGPVATLVDLSSVYVRVNLPERYVRFIKNGEKVRVWIAAASEQPYDGTIKSVSGEGDAEARTFAVRVEVDNDGHLRAAMSARVEFPVGSPRQALAVSKDAVLLRGNQSFVFVVNDKGLAEIRPVATGASSGGKFETLHGLASGDKVVVKGNERLQPGMPVRIIQANVPGKTSAGNPPRASGEAPTTNVSPTNVPPEGAPVANRQREDDTR